ncbi:MAG: LamG domain-containing protein [Solirubrobacteraceae bacterium]
MRKEAALIGVLAMLGWCAAPASAAPNLLAHWTLDEGIGQVAGDTSGQGNNGELGSSAAPDGADPAWIQGHDGGDALSFDGSSYVTVPDTGVLEPQHIAVDVWVQHAGSPGQWRYVLSKGSVQCDRSAYGLYSGFDGGMAFYVSGESEYTISPEVSAATVWDGGWHHVIGSYDGERVRLWIDGSQVGTGTPASTAIAYANGSKGIYIGTYLGSCSLGFRGAIDDVAVWDDVPPAATTGPVIAPVPNTPTHVASPRAGGASAPGAAVAGKSAPLSCPRVTLSRHTIPVRRKTKLIATVRRNGRRVAGARIVVSGDGVTTTGARTNREGTTKLAVQVRRAGRLKVKVSGQKSNCAALTVRAR